MSPEYWGALLFNKQLVVWGNVLDICTLYGANCKKEVSKMLKELFKSNKHYSIQVQDYIPFLFGVSVTLFSIIHYLVSLL